jgi:hypothetical protein
MTELENSVLGGSREAAVILNLFASRRDYYDAGAKITSRTNDDNVFDLRWRRHCKIEKCSKVGEI